MSTAQREYRVDTLVELKRFAERLRTSRHLIVRHAGATLLQAANSDNHEVQEELWKAAIEFCSRFLPHLSRGDATG